MRVVPFFETLFGIARARIAGDSPDGLTIEYGTRVTVFNRRTGTVHQGSHLVATFPSITSVELQQLQRARESPRWEVRLRLDSGGDFKVGDTPEPEEASIIAAHIGTATGKPVSIDPRLG